MNSKRKLIKNTYCSLLYHIVLIVCGIILPRFLLRYYGSLVNGLVNSISQFMQLIAFLELGVGSVVESELYKPLAENDRERISKIVSSAEKFYQILGITILGYILLMCCIYPAFVKSDFERIYTILLIIVMSIGFLTQYYFGVVDRLLLSAAQQGYITYIVQTITLVFSTILSAFLMYIGASVHVVKLMISFIYLVRPLMLRVYVKKHYDINRHTMNSVEPITQKWNGIAQHIASVVLENTDVIVLTVLSSLQNVSVYSVYHMIIYGIKMIMVSMTAGVRSFLGDIWARKEYEALNVYFDRFEWVMHSVITIVFTCTAILVIPFVKIYTLGINDASYEQPLFSAFLVLANACHCLRMPYSTMIMAAGHYKQTQAKYIVSALINVCISIMLVKVLGLVGVALGTLIAMIYQTVWMADYTYKHFIKSVSKIEKQFCIDIIICGMAFFICRGIYLVDLTFLDWTIMALKVLITTSIVSFFFNCIFYKNNMISILEITKKHKL